MLDLRSIYPKVEWDLTTNRINGALSGKKGDTGRGMEIYLVRNGEFVVPSTEVLSIRYTKDDNTGGYVEAVLDNGKFLIENTSQIFAIAGKVICELELYVDGEFIKSADFTITSIDSRDVDGIISESEYTFVQQFIIESQTMKVEIVDMKASEVDRKSSESTRKTSETARVLAENGRVTAEGTRVTNESARVGSENTRKTSETTRVNNEGIRVANDVTRPIYLYKTQAEYDALSPQQKADTKYIYEITDSVSNYPSEIQAIVDDLVIGYDPRLRGLENNIESVESQLADVGNRILSVKDPRFGVKGDTVLDSNNNYISGTDDTDALKSAIAYAKANKIQNIRIPSGIYLINGDSPSGTYFFYDGGLYIDFPLNIIMDSDTILKVKTSALNGYNCITIKNANHVSVMGGNIIGERKSHIGTIGEFGFGIFIKDSNNILIDGVAISDVWGDGIYSDFNIANDGTCVNDLIIRNCVLDNNRRQGITLSDGTRMRIINNTIKNTSGKAPQSGIDVEGNDSIVRDLLISNNHFDSNVGADITISNNVYDVRIIENVFNTTSYSINVSPTNCTVESLLIQGNKINGLTSSIRGININPISGKGITISNNYVQNILTAVDSSGIQINNIPLTDTIINGNTVYNCSTGIVVRSDTMVGLNITNNTVDTTIAVGIDCNGSITNAVISNNYITKSGTIGLRVRTQYGTVVGNTIVDVQQHGIYIYAATNNIISDNVIHKFAQAGGSYSGIHSDLSTSFSNIIKGNRLTVVSGTPFAIRISNTPAGNPNIIEGNFARYTTSTIIAADVNCIVKYNHLGSVTEASDKLLTTSGSTSIVSFNPIVQGNFAVNVFYRVVSTATNITITLNYTDGSGASQSVQLVNVTGQVVGVYSISTFINAKSAPGITINATASIANQVYISANVRPI